MSQSSTLRTLFISAWLLIVVAIVWALANQDRFFAVDNRPIALLEETEGAVATRTQGLVRWQESVPRQGVFDGDRIATGWSASARIRFDAARYLAMAEDTQIQVTAIVTAEQGSAFLITLFRGSVVAHVEAECDRCPPLVIRAGDDTYNISAGKRVGIHKPVGRKAKTFDPKGPPPVSAQKPKWLTLSDSPQPAPPPEKPAPPPAPPPKVVETLDIKGYEPELKVPSSGGVWHTMEPLTSLDTYAIEIPIVAPSSLPPRGTWRPWVQLIGPGGRRVEIPLSSVSNGMARIPVARVRSIARVQRGRGFTDYVFQVRAGAEVVDGTSRQRRFGERPLSLSIRSFAINGLMPLQIALDRLQNPTGKSIWLTPKNEIDVADAPIVIELTKTADYPKIHPYLAGAGQVGLSGRTSTVDGGFFVVRGKDIVARVSGTGLQPTVFQKILEVLQADFVFEGRRSALFVSNAGSTLAQERRAGALLDQGKSLYILRKNKLYPVSSEFVKTNEEVARFIDSQAGAIFLEAVRIVSYR